MFPFRPYLPLHFSVFIYTACCKSALSEIYMEVDISSIPVLCNDHFPNMVTVMLTFKIFLYIVMAPSIPPEGPRPSKIDLVSLLVCFFLHPINLHPLLAWSSCRHPCSYVTVSQEENDIYLWKNLLISLGIYFCWQRLMRLESLSGCPRTTLLQLNALGTRCPLNPVIFSSAIAHSFIMSLSWKTDSSCGCCPITVVLTLCCLTKCNYLIFQMFLMLVSMPAKLWSILIYSQLAKYRAHFRMFWAKDSFNIYKEEFVWPWSSASTWIFSIQYHSHPGLWRLVFSGSLKLTQGNLLNEETEALRLINSLDW